MWRFSRLIRGPLQHKQVAADVCVFSKLAAVREGQKTFPDDVLLGC